MQNDPHKCKIKLEKFHFDILCRFGVIKESLQGGDGISHPPIEIGLNWSQIRSFTFSKLFTL